MTILQDMTQATDLQAEIEKLRAENERLKATARSKLRCKVSEKGAVSVYGMGKWPVTLYRGQWERLLDGTDVIRAFVEAHASELSVKG